MDERIRRHSVEYWAAVKPHATAIIDGENTVSWETLNARADALADSLAERGLGADDIIVTRCRIRHEWAVVAAAAAKLGCRLLGLNWRLTLHECQFILRDSGAKAIFFDDEDPEPLSSALRESGLSIAVTLDTQAPGVIDYAGLLTRTAPGRFSLGHAPLIIYTSGTTSLPKGVLPRVVPPAEADQLGAYHAELAASRDLVAGDVVMITMPFHHASGPWQVRSNMDLGNTLVFVRRFEPEQALADIQRWRVTSWAGVPTMFKRLSALPSEVLNSYDVSSIRILYVGGAPTPSTLKDWIIDYFGQRLQEGYGSTELGMVAILPADMQRQKPLSAGRVLDTVDVSVRDPSGHELPPDAPGRIWFRSPGMLSGYINHPPLGPDVMDDRGFFRSGDCGYLDSERYLYITDREVDMVISGGVNIYPAEIEAAILRHPAIQDVAVIGVPDEEFGERLLAFCELAPETTATEPEIITHTRNLVASYKVPKHVEFVDELPRNSVGKLLKRVLRDPYWNNAERNI
ncbi:class I adenylate-forming enzyme family protein [Rhodococcus opacus]|uniref:Fatty-acid--CoA ligase n=1 Tax=Rhodococcus opacus TaxID=37919 RepID=A0A076EY18_RHOOP|nr:AMP-binding protein [Rhodococcus opacus]AII10701.1 hypothetical protein EP51_41565 [Rhodococcus opacus]